MSILERNGDINSQENSLALSQRLDTISCSRESKMEQHPDFPLANKNNSTTRKGKIIGIEIVKTSKVSKNDYYFFVQ